MRAVYFGLFFLQILIIRLMKKILILGAGLSASSLIKYLLDHSQENDWKVVLGDQSKELAEKKINGHPHGEAIFFDVFDEGLRKQEIAKADLVISMLPAMFHPLVARDCVDLGKHMLTASYVSKEIKEMDEEARSKDLLLLNEIGVDPGIDHMSAMRVIDEIKNSGAELLEFESSTGGLVAPEFDNNPWNYKFTWNPRNVVLAGQGSAQFLHNGRLKYIPYHKLFQRTEIVDVLDYGKFEIYANRDSLQYQDVYKLGDIQTLFRGTIRKVGYTAAWDVFVQLGLTDDSIMIENKYNMTYRNFINSFLPYHKSTPVEKKICDYLGLKPNCEIMKKLEWLGIFEDKPIGMERGTPAQILQKLLESKWTLDPDDKDMIIMQHKFVYRKEGKTKERKSTMVVIGRDQVHTAMSITVGVPVAIAAKLLLQGKLTARGVQVPVVADIYEPLLEELSNYGIKFIEEERELED
jgi:saccharopine dehydrogenase-like NADP-dependent oxidoreductase